jgi:hypothetical protein
MQHRPKAVDTNYRASGKLEDKKVIISGWMAQFVLEVIFGGRNGNSG